MNYKNILGNLGAIYIFAQGVYPGLNGEMIIHSIANGTIFQHMANLALAYIAFNYGKEPKTISYVFPEDD
jgi:hypothetical protein